MSIYCQEDQAAVPMGEPAQGAESDKRHAFKDDITWMGSGRDGDPWVMCSWGVKWCSCATPWRHGWLA